MIERLLVAAGIFVAGHFTMSYIIPAPVASPWWLLFPFGRPDALATWTFGRIDGLPLAMMLGLAGIAVLAFIGAFLATFGAWVPSDWWRVLLVVGASCSIVLYVLHLGPWAVAPLALNLALLWLALASAWAPGASA